MKTKKYFTPDVNEILKNNKTIDVDLLIKSAKECNELKKLGVTPERFNLVLPYTRSVTVDR